MAGQPPERLGELVVRTVRGLPGLLSPLTKLYLLILSDAIGVVALLLFWAANEQGSLQPVVEVFLGVESPYALKAPVPAAMLALASLFVAPAIVSLVLGYVVELRVAGIRRDAESVAGELLERYVRSVGSTREEPT